MLINAIIAFGLLFVLIVPLYIASRTSSKNKRSELRNRCMQLLSELKMIPLQQEIIGNKVIVFTEDERVLILHKNETEEELLVLNRSNIHSFIAKEIAVADKLAEIQLLYKEAGKDHAFSFYKQHRDNALDIAQLRKVTNDIKQFLK